MPRVGDPRRPRRRAAALSGLRIPAPGERRDPRAGAVQYLLRRRPQGADRRGRHRQQDPTADRDLAAVPELRPHGAVPRRTRRRPLPALRRRWLGRHRPGADPGPVPALALAGDPARSLDRRRPGRPRGSLLPDGRPDRRRARELPRRQADPGDPLRLRAAARADAPRDQLRAPRRRPVRQPEGRGPAGRRRRLPGLPRLRPGPARGPRDRPRGLLPGAEARQRGAAGTPLPLPRDRVGGDSHPASGLPGRPRQQARVVQGGPRARLSPPLPGQPGPPADQVDQRAGGRRAAAVPGDLRRRSRRHRLPRRAVARRQLPRRPGRGPAGARDLRVPEAPRPRRLLPLPLRLPAAARPGADLEPRGAGDPASDPGAAGRGRGGADALRGEHRLADRERARAALPRNPEAAGGGAASRSVSATAASRSAVARGA